MKIITTSYIYDVDWVMVNNVAYTVMLILLGLVISLLVMCIVAE